MRSSAFNGESGRLPAVSGPSGAGSWARVDMATRRHALRNLFVERAPTLALAERIDQVRADRDALSEPTCILMTGDTGVGKSSFLKSYAARHPSRREGGCLIQPVVYAEFPSKITLIGAAKLLLDKLDDPSKGKGNLADLTHRVHHQTQAQCVEVYLLDEFQHIVETGDNTVNKVADWFKQVAKAANVPLVMAGMPTADRVIRSNPQFAGITPYRYVLDQFEFGTKLGRVAFREFLARVDQALPFDGVAGLADMEWATALFDGTGGRLRPLMRLLKQAALHALNRGSANIGQVDLAYGYQQIEPVDAKVDNPFGDVLAA